MARAERRARQASPRLIAGLAVCLLLAHLAFGLHEYVPSDHSGTAPCAICLAGGGLGQALAAAPAPAGLVPAALVVAAAEPALPAVFPPSRYRHSRAPPA